MKSLWLNPSPPLSNVTDSRFGNFETFGQDAEALAGGAYFSNYLGSKFGLPILRTSIDSNAQPAGRRMQSGFIGMPDVLATCRPFEIQDQIVGRIAISVIHFRKVQRIIKKGLRNKSRDIALPRLSIRAKAHHATILPLMIDPRAENLARSCACPCQRTSDTSVIRDLVKIFITKNRTPKLSNQRGLWRRGKIGSPLAEIMGTTKASAQSAAVITAFNRANGSLGLHQESVLSGVTRGAVSAAPPLSILLCGEAS